MMRVAFAVSILALLSSCASLSHGAAEQACNGSFLDIDGNTIWVNSQGTKSPTVVFESGFGNDSSVWASLEKQVREKGFRTFVYDRAGLGKSMLGPASVYSIDNDVHVLKSALAKCSINGRLVVVGHSYGGAMALVLAENNENIKGLVLLDAVVPGVWGQGELEKNLATMRSQYDAIRMQAPKLAQVAIPWAESLPKTTQRIDNVRLPASLPIIDIVAENGQETPTSTAIWRQAHERFVSSDRNRTYVLAKGSSHKVMHDREQIVLDAIMTMLARSEELRSQ